MFLSIQLNFPKDKVNKREIKQKGERTKLTNQNNFITWEQRITSCNDCKQTKGVKGIHTAVSQQNAKPQKVEENCKLLRYF